MKKMIPFMSILQSHCHFKLDFQNVDHYTGGKWLIRGTKHQRDNQLQSLELPCRITSYDKLILLPCTFETKIQKMN